MYTLRKSIVQPENQRGTWFEMNLLHHGLRLIASEYSKAYFYIYSKILDREIIVSLEDYRSEFERSDYTFYEYLEVNKNKSFIESQDKISLKDRKVRYKDAFSAGYKLKATPSKASHDSELSLIDRPYIYMEKKGVNPNTFYKHCLVTVNGYIHRVDVSDSGIWIMDGMKTVLKGDKNEVGILSFKELGSLEIIPIKENMIYKQVLSNTLYDQCYIDLKKSTYGKTIILIIGGYLYIYNYKTFRRVGESQIRIDFKQVNLFEKYHESKRTLDFSDAPLDKGHDSDHVSIGNLTSDAFIRYYLTLPQSFIVLLDNEDIYVDKTHLRVSKIPGQYISHTKPTEPMILGYGKIGNYWKRTGDKEWVLNLSDNQYHNWNYLTTSDPSTLESITNSRDTQHPTDHSQAYLLNIGTTLVKE